MKKNILFLIVFWVSISYMDAQTYCLSVEKISQTASKLVVKFKLSSPSPTSFVADASFVIEGTGGISGTALVAGSASGLFNVGNSLSYYVSNPASNPAGTYEFNIVGVAPATFLVDNNEASGFGVYTLVLGVPTWLADDNSCPINGISVVLPLELNSFTAIKDSKNGINKTIVQWESLGEKNLSNYIIERSDDGKNFKPLGFEKPKAKSEVEKAAYSFVDDQPEIGINYYRLQSKGVRKEDFKYSKVVSVDFGLGLKAKAFPNPFAAELSIELDIEQGVKGEVTIDMFDTAGKQVLNKKITAEGRKLVFEVPTEGLVPGSYVIRVKNGSYTWQHKITKQ